MGLCLRKEVYHDFMKYNDVAILAGLSAGFIFKAVALLSQRIGYIKLVFPSICLGFSGDMIAYIGIFRKLCAENLRQNETPVTVLQLSQEYIEKCIQFLAHDYKEFWSQKFQGERNPEDACNVKLEFMYAFGLGLLKVLDAKQNDKKLNPSMTEFENKLHYFAITSIFQSVDKNFVESIQEEIDDYIDDFKVDVSKNSCRYLLYCRIINVLEEFLPKYQTEYAKFKSRWSGNLENIESLNDSILNIKIWFGKFKSECENQIASFDSLNFHSEQFIETFEKLIQSADRLGNVLERGIEEASCVKSLQGPDSNHSACSDQHVHVFQPMRLELGEIRTKLDSAIQMAKLVQTSKFDEYGNLITEENTGYVGASTSSQCGDNSTNIYCAVLCEDDGEKTFSFEENEKSYFVNLYRLKKELDLEKIYQKKLVKDIAKAKELAENGVTKKHANPAEMKALDKCHKDPIQEIPMSEENLTFALKYLANDVVGLWDEMSNDKCAGALELEDIPFELTFAFAYGLKKAIDLRLNVKLEKVCTLNGAKHFLVKHSSKASEVLKTIDDELCGKLKQIIDRFNEEISKVGQLNRSLLVCEVLYELKEFHKLYRQSLQQFENSEDLVEVEDSEQQSPNPVTPMEKIMEKAEILELIRKMEKQHMENPTLEISEIVNELTTKKKVSFDVNVKQIEENEQSDPFPFDFEVQ